MLQRFNKMRFNFTIYSFKWGLLFSGIYAAQKV